MNNNRGCSVNVGSIVFIPATLSTFILLILKIIGVGSISWFWVFSPLLIGIGLMIALIILWVLFALILVLIQAYLK